MRFESADLIDVVLPLFLNVLYINDKKVLFYWEKPIFSLPKFHGFRAGPHPLPKLRFFASFTDFNGAKCSVLEP